MDCKNIKGNVIVIFRTGREANKFIEGSNTSRFIPFYDDHGMCAYRFFDGECSGCCSNPRVTYKMGDDYANCKTVNFRGIVYDVVFYREKAVIL